MSGGYDGSGPLPLDTVPLPYQSPGRVRAPEPHLPLRKASPHRLQPRKRTPHPLLFTSANGTEGFHPATGASAATPYYTPVNASSGFNNDHLEPGSEERQKKSFETVVPERQDRYGPAREDWSQPGVGGLQWDKDVTHSPRNGSAPNLKGSRSVSEGLRGLRERLTKQRGIDSSWSPDSDTPPTAIADDVRTSFRSALTSNSSFMDSTISTERSSTHTGHSSHSDIVKIYPTWPDTHDEDFGVEDAIGLYADGFGTPMRQSFETAAEHDSSLPRPSSSPHVGPRPNPLHRRSYSAVFSAGQRPSMEQNGHLAVPSIPRNYVRESADIIAGKNMPSDTTQSQDAPPPPRVPRDRYGFKKVSHYVTLEQFDAWEKDYNLHVERRNSKWEGLLKQYGLATNNPTRFPPKTDKVKRYVRKGIPPAWRGAAWFWYAGGPGLQKTHEGVYYNLLRQIKQDNALKDIDKEHIERDLNRTFPDNIRFKPDPPPVQGQTYDGSSDGDLSDGSSQPETPIVRALRRVLQAFAVHNPGIGYCQSLNFIAGLLLLFLDEDEEKTFILLNIVTSDYLPGTHGVSLEGANIDIAVLMLSIKELLPTIWTQIDDRATAHGGTDNPTALPTVSLATTAWFMSLFVGTLPIECVLRTWDCLFFEGSKTLFRIALAIFKAAEVPIKAINDPMEVFQLVQSMPRSMVDANALMELCFKKRGGFGNLSQDTVEKRREERRQETRQGRAMTGNLGKQKLPVGTIKGRFRSKTKGAG